MEMSKRMAFLGYILLFTTYLIACVIAVARPGVVEIAVAISSLMALAAVRYAGYRWLDFNRLCESFPSGCAMDEVPDKIRNEVEALVAEFHATETDWVRRVEIRHRLVELEEEEPKIVEAYSDELRQVLAA